LGCARVSTTEQNPDLQARLRAARARAAGQRTASLLGL